MATLNRFTRAVLDCRMALRGQDRIENVPTDLFNQLLREHLAAGWLKTYEYDGFDAWIDYGRVDLRRDRHQLVFEWDNWFEGEITGPAALVHDLARSHALRLAPWRRLALR